MPASRKKGIDMAVRISLTLTMVSVTLALVGCGKAGPDGATASSSEGRATQLSWSAADACSILGKEEAAAILKQEISETQLSLVHEAGSAEAATSECAYLGADGSSVARMMARWSPINDNTADAIATARSTTAATMKAFTSAPLEDVPGLGKAAFLATKVNQLNVFLDDARMVIITVEKVPDGASGKDLAIAIAKKIGA